MLTTLLPLLLACVQPTPQPQTSVSLSAIERRTGDANTGADVVVVALHGLGDRPKNFARVFDGFTTPARLLLPPGPHAYSKGYSWFSVDRRDAAAFAQDLAAQADALARRLVGRPIVTGFSQGGMLSFAIAVRHADRVSAAYPVGGALPETLIPKVAPIDGPRIVALHGEDDIRVNFAATDAAVRSLKAAGFDAAMRSYPGVGHSISPQMRADLDALIGGGD